MGYVGPAVVRSLRTAYPDATIIGYDSGLFAHCLTTPTMLPENLLSMQVFGDVRDISPSLLEGCTAVIHLAAISNDPMGDKFSDVTQTINQEASIVLARMSASAGVRNFVFASSCSVYGVAEGKARQENDPVNPITAYARSKIGTEEGLRSVGGGMVITCLRFATACGMSDRLRLDLVLNDFVAGALTSGKITVLSDGSPWRPLIDTADMARAINWSSTRNAENGGQYLIVNAGSDNANRQVADLAHSVAHAVEGTLVSINTGAPVDARSYKVDFSLYSSLAPAHLPTVSLDQSIAELITGLKAIGFANTHYRESHLIRLKMLDAHLTSGRLGHDVRWKDSTRSTVKIAA